MVALGAGCGLWPFALPARDNSGEPSLGHALLGDHGRRPAVPGLFCEGLRVRATDWHAVGQRWPRGVDPDCLGFDGRGPSHAAPMAVLGTAPDPLALSLGM